MRKKNVAKYFEAIVSGIWIKIGYRKDLPFSRSDPKILNFVISIQTRQFQSEFMLVAYGLLQKFTVQKPDLVVA